MDYDVLIIGAGSAGYVCAVRAAQLGATVCLIEKEAVGGTCLNWGCIPTKTLLNTAERYQTILNAEEFGLTAENPDFDLEKIQDRKQNVVDGLVKGIRRLFKTNKINFIEGKATIIDKNSVKCNDETITCSNLVIASGSEPLDIPAFNIDGKQVLTSTEALELTEIPESILIVGGGVIGCEFATLFNAFGADVTILEMMPQLLPTEDSSIANYLKSMFKRKKINIKLKEKIDEIKKEDDGIIAELSSGKSVKAEKALISIGRKLISSGFGVENLGLDLGKNGAITVDKKMRTNVEGVYAIGDVTGEMLLAHVASAQGMLVAEQIAGDTERTMNYNLVPNCIFTTPEIARVGLTEEDVKENGIEDYKVGKVSFRAIGKAQAIGEPNGFAKIIADSSDKILGVHIIGAHATNLIHEAVVAMENEMTATELSHAIHAHPTLAEVILETAEAVNGLAIHG